MKYIIAVLFAVLALSGCNEELSESESFSIELEKSWDGLTDRDRTDLCWGYDASPELILGIFMSMAEEDGSAESYTEDVVEEFLNEACKTN